MDFNLPAGSRISIAYGEVDPTIVIPAKASASRYFAGTFLLFWLGAWAFGWLSASRLLLSGQGGLFLIFWLGAWTVGGCLAAFAAYRVFRPAVPETLQLRRGSVAYDSGLPPLEFNTFSRNRNGMEFWGSLFAKRVRAELDREQLQTLRLRETEAGNRLTIDLGARRLELASQASEVEREWLAGVLVKRYGLTQVVPGAASPAS